MQRSECRLTSLLKDWNFTRVNFSLVIVPVLSNATTLRLAKASRTSPPFMRSPILAAFSSAQKNSTCVERTSVQGHALTRKTNANWNQLFLLWILISKGMDATPAAAITTTA
ncbi:hypothetical protein Cni_G19381 [Canna indica]|uniref:Uncharacterized protein n=1 Tax=Canna indica TaxID=4628 RepID=A0AAQ3KRG4_9LILI|nr:hypothetical protein Cni_G19381 [Canna indica]